MQATQTAYCLKKAPTGVHRQILEGHMPPYAGTGTRNFTCAGGKPEFNGAYIKQAGDFNGTAPMG